MNKTKLKFRVTRKTEEMMHVVPVGNLNMNDKLAILLATSRTGKETLNDVMDKEVGCGRNAVTGDTDWNGIKVGDNLTADLVDWRVRLTVLPSI